MAIESTSSRGEVTYLYFLTEGRNTEQSNRSDWIILRQLGALGGAIQSQRSTVFRKISPRFPMVDGVRKIRKLDISEIVPQFQPMKF